MKYDLGLDMKALVFGAAIAAAFIIFGYRYWDWFYPFSAIGLLYAGYGQGNIKTGTLMGALASTAIVVLFLEGYFGQPSGFFATEDGIVAIAALIIITGAFIGFVGAWSKRSRVKALEEYEKKQNIGKTKKKKAVETQTEEKQGFLSKIFKK
ncbi:hypothetical protein [uncultured Methanobrevibacter sp.]|uniref:hypothetical protein n=1 Tax=uncultured Methanobrevibacter sp. TaxID=253161 RepID=UPI002608A42E|nr:hypothetical protein [uncultured Methanobrevibacter sp.]